jgi:hypothetical protein
MEMTEDFYEVFAAALAVLTGMMACEPELFGPLSYAAVEEVSNVAKVLHLTTHPAVSV